METQEAKPRRVRGKSIRTQLQQVLNEAACASGADADTKKLIQTRIIALSKLLRFDQSRKLRAEFETLRSENQQLKERLTQALAGQSSPVSIEIEQALAKYRAGE